MAYDVVVVGAGPAGSSAARAAAERGLKVLLLEKDSYPGENNACGGGINPYTYEKLKLPKRIVQKEIRGMGFYSKLFRRNFHSRFDFSKPAATVLRRDFDKYLAEKAQDAGAELVTNSLVKKVEGNTVFAKKKYKGALIIGADGTFSVVKKSMGLPLPMPGKIAPGLVYEVKADYATDDIELFFNPAFRNGYIWIFPKRNVLNIGIGSVGGKSYNFKEKLDSFIKNKFKHYTITRRMAGVVPMTGPLKQTVKGNKLLVGDAAGHTGVAFGEGIHYAVDIGELAGEYCAKYFDGTPLEEYDTEWHSMYSTAYLAEKVFLASANFALLTRTHPFFFKVFCAPLLTPLLNRWITSKRVLKHSSL